MQRSSASAAQAGGGFVQQQQARPDGQRAREFEPPLLAEREVAGGGLRLRRQANQGEEFIGAATRFAFGAAEARQAQRAGEHAVAEVAMQADEDIVARGHFHEQLGVLEGTRDAARGDAMRREAGQRLAIQQHLAGCRRVEARDEVDEGGFAGAVRADDGVDGAGRDIDRDGIKRDQPTEADTEVLDPECGAHRAPLAPRRKDSPAMPCGETTTKTRSSSENTSDM